MRKRIIATAQMQHPSLEGNEKRPTTSKPLFDEVSGYIKQAALFKSDFICLPEIFANLNRSQKVKDTAEALDGKIMSFLQKQSKKYSIGIITTVYIRECNDIVNMGVAFNANGNLIGKYNKVHLAPGEEIKAGTSFPVFEMQGIRLGMQICYDLNFPEGCRCIALQDADIVFWPNLWGGMPESYTDVIMRARAMENQIFLVSSAMFFGGSAYFRAPKIFGRSCIVSRDGVILAEVGHRTGIAVAEVDFDAEHCRHAECHKVMLKDRKPETYKILTDKSLNCKQK